MSFLIGWQNKQGSEDAFRLLKITIMDSIDTLILAIFSSFFLSKYVYNKNGFCRQFQLPDNMLIILQHARKVSFFVADFSFFFYYFFVKKIKCFNLLDEMLCASFSFSLFREEVNNIHTDISGMLHICIYISVYLYIIYGCRFLQTCSGF